MIFIDPTETTTTSRCPPIPGATPAPSLESTTGADIAISPLTMPFSAKLLPRHLAAGMLLIQRKSGADLCASITDNRLYTSLARMRSTGAAQWQCILVTTGRYEPAKNDQVRIATPTFHADGRVTYRNHLYPHMRYTATQSAIEGWTWHGGVYLPLSCDDEIPTWCKRTETRLKDKSGVSFRELWPTAPKIYDPSADDDPLQELVLVTGWRAILASFKGIGPVKVNALKAEMVARNVDDTLLQALIWITSGSEKIPGWGKKLRASVTDQLGGSGAWASLVKIRNQIKEKS